MSSNTNVVYFHQGLFVVGGALEMNGLDIVNADSISMGNWKIRKGELGSLEFVYDQEVKASINHDTDTSSTNFRCERFFMVETVDIGECIGMIVSTTGEIYNQDLSQTPNIDTAVSPKIVLTNKANDPSVVGTIVGSEMYSRKIDMRFISSEEPQIDDINRVLVNTSNMGVIWVCELGGELRQGDLLTSSPLKGYAMKQKEDVYKRSTIGKSYFDTDFTDETIIMKKVIDFDEDGPIYEDLKDLEGDIMTAPKCYIRYVHREGGIEVKLHDFKNDLLRVVAENKNITNKFEALKRFDKRRIFRCALVPYIAK